MKPRLIKLGVLGLSFCVLAPFVWTAGTDNAVMALPRSGMVIPESFSDCKSATSSHIECHIPIHNSGPYTESLEIKDVSCGCVQATLSAREYQPGKSGFISVLIESPFLRSNPLQWLSEVVRAAEFTVFASHSGALEPAAFRVSVRLRIRSAIQVSDGRILAVDADCARSGEGMLVPLLLEPTVRIVNVACDDPILAGVFEARLTKTKEGRDAISMHWLEVTTAKWPRPDSSVLLELQSNNSVFWERIPVRFFRARPVSVHPNAIVLSKKNFNPNGYELIFTSPHTIRSISPMHVSSATNAGIAVQMHDSLHRCIVRIEPCSSGIVNYTLGFEVIVQDKQGVTTEETIRVPVVGDL